MIAAARLPLLKRLVKASGPLDYPLPSVRMMYYTPPALRMLDDLGQ